MPETAAVPVGLAGLGQMGMPMARRLVASGRAVVGFDVAPDAIERAEAAGVQAASEPTGLARCDPIILMLPDSDVVERVLVTEGLLAALDDGSLVIDMSSSVPKRTRSLAAAATASAVELIDAPVSGGVVGAESGTLTIMVGGPESAVARARPVLDVLGGRVVHTGDVGSGHAVKALNNLMSATHLLATSEALLAARSFGLDIERVLGVVNGSSGRSGSSETKWPHYVLPETFNSGFRLSLMLKDMRIALALEQDAGAYAPLSEAAVSLWSDAAAELGSDADHTEIVRWLEARATDVTFRREHDEDVRRMDIHEMAPATPAD